MIKRSGSRLMDPDPGGQKTYGSYGSGSATLVIFFLYAAGMGSQQHGCPAEGAHLGAQAQAGVGRVGGQEARIPSDSLQQSQVPAFFILGYSQSQEASTSVKPSGGGAGSYMVILQQQHQVPYRYSRYSTVGTYGFSVQTVPGTVGKSIR